ncbi:hypothetical protein CDD81_1331 [Ophiocordyceps australis]|uniref:Uncharacterized protein n=1 Tax=Ophiocordyceps australis TaxID=1399860 RepID=A0A2C5XZ97_9HYPO|nr:hypothetical protein CDD81_1331 [Ophiocordyceps australis]
MASRRQQPLRRTSSATSMTSTWSWASGEDRMAQTKQHQADACLWPGKTHSRQNSSASSRSCEGMTADETRELWKCMLQLQRQYACYKSTRIDLAASAGQAADSLMPNPFIIDTLNNSVVDLPKEARDMLDQRLQPTSGCTAPKTKRKRKFWSRH